MPEWLYEAGIGENRAALVADGQIVEAAIELDGLRVGHIARARLIERAIVRLDSGEEAQLTGAPGGAAQGSSDAQRRWKGCGGVAEGGMLTVAITREAIPEPGRVKPPRAVATDAAPMPGPDLLARITATGLPVRHATAHGADTLEAAGWTELLEEAAHGDIPFTGGALRMTPTPAMTLFDVDGSAPLEPLAVRAAAAVALAIRRHGIGGSIGIDFPTLGGKAARMAVATALDAHLPPPFERTAVNGFGFLQIVRPRPRASLPEQLRADPVAAAARATLRRLEREPGPTHRHRLPPAVLAYLLARPHWLAELARRTGRHPDLESA
ncbi:MAG: ribonuclease [Sphingomonas bacterium]|uniref:ribonuclease n=1 Tax=Sphingomonas bacterium TaxID=1895847 RepID=UPI0026032416|nr:ribonuclease [Sphingomonas bacterium]MDB5694938.1 ribonuclease [Sphingomonas bacterium]